MHPDRKIGIAMGILLVGVVAALFFRNEPLPVDETLSLRRENELNERLRERDVAVYLDTTRTETDSDAGEPQWTLSELLNGGNSADEALPISVKDTTAAPESRALPPSPAFAPPVRSEPQNIVDTDDPDSYSRIASKPSPTDTDVITSHVRDEEDTRAPALQDDGYKEYQIQYGDTLSGISQRFLGSHQRYSEIYNANKDRIDNPDRLRVGTAIRIPRAIH